MLEAAIKQKPDWDFQLISPKALHPGHSHIYSRPNVEVTVDRSVWSKTGPTWLHFRLPHLIRTIQPDLFWSTLFLLPVRYTKRSNVPVIMNVHDVNPFVAPRTMKTWNRIYSSLFLRESIRMADRVLCLSFNTKNDILQTVANIDERKLAVLYPGISKPPELRSVPASLPGDVKEFFLSVGTLEARKNFDTLIHAYNQARVANSYIPPLVIAGSPGWKAGQLLDDLKQGKLQSSGVYFVSKPSDAELFWLYENATALFFPSLHEGFGLPMLEALHFKKPVYVSDIAIFREILPDADFIAPLDIAGWAYWFQYLCRNQGKVLTLNESEWTYEYRAKQLCNEFETTSKMTSKASEATATTKH